MPPFRATALLLILPLMAGCGAADGPAATLPGDGPPGPQASAAADRAGPASSSTSNGGLPSDPSLEADALTTSPFTGPACSGLIAIGGRAPMGLFSVAGRPALVAPEDDTEEADQDPPALLWLAAQQAPDGGWEEDLAEDAQHSSDAGLTGRVLLAFLASGQTNRGRHAFAKVVSRGLRFLKNHQAADGWYGTSADGPNEQDLTQHAPACAAMVEAYAQTTSPIFKGAAARGLQALAEACAAEHQDLREPAVAYEALVSLIAARRIARDYTRREKRVPFVISREAFEALARQRTPPGRASAEDVAIAILARHAFDDVRADEARTELQALGNRLTARPLSWAAYDRGSGSATWPLTHLALELTRHESLDRGERDARALLFAQQTRADDTPTLRGSWDPGALPGCRERRIGLTARCLAALWRTQ